MTRAIRQSVNVKAGGVIELQAPELCEGERADVIVLYEPTDKQADNEQATSTASVEQSQRKSPRKDDETRGKEGWRDFAGIFNSGDPNGGDNDRIDADLAREYAKGLDD